MINNPHKNSVLIVDDETANIIALTHILSPEYKIYAAKNGRDALEIVHEHLPDVILLDVLMPDMDGYEVLVQLKHGEKTRTIPVIFITGLGGADNEEKGLKLGAADYISKPYSSATVKLRVQNHVKIVNQMRALDEQRQQQELMLHSMEAQILITEIETDNIIFINHNMKKAFGLTRDIRGEKCWQHFQTDYDKRCDFCPKNKPEFSTGEPILWEERNPLTGRHHRIICRMIDWYDGTKVYFQQRDDITELVDATAKLNEHLQQQVLMTNIAHHFLTDAQADSLYADTLCMVGEFMDIEQILLYKLENDNVTLTCQSEWIKPELQLKTCIGHQLELKEPMLSIMHNLLASRKSDLCLHSNDPVFREAMTPYRTRFHNYIATPVFIKGEMRAVLDFSRKDDGREWSESEINLAVLISSIFSGVFERDAMERQFSMVENSPNLLLYLASDGKVEYANPASNSITGYSKHEMIAGGLGLIFGKKVLTEITEKHLPNALRGNTVHFETNIIRKNGEKRVLAVSVVQIGKNSLGMLTRDLTEIRQLEAGLIVAKERAEHSSRAKSDFLSRMSHEMLTPMNAVMGLTEVIKIKGLPDNLKEFFDEIANASNELLRLIKEVLDMSGVEYGVFKLADSVFDIGTMVRDILHTTEIHASEKHQVFRTKIDPVLPVSLIGDERRLKQVLTTLLANAIKFTPEQGEISFSVRVLDTDGEIVTLQFEIDDNGIGIPKEYQSRVFDLFEQADGGMTRKHGGIGIGLALSKRIIELMGGTIWVDSEPNEGSTFTFTCQLKKGE